MARPSTTLVTIPLSLGSKSIKDQQLPALVQEITKDNEGRKEQPLIIFLSKNKCMKVTTR